MSGALFMGAGPRRRLLAGRAGPAPAAGLRRRGVRWSRKSRGGCNRLFYRNAERC